VAPSNCNAVSCCRVSCSLSSWAAHGAEACSRASGTPVEDLCGSASCKIEPRATWSSQSARSLGLDIARFTWDVLARSDRTYSASRAGPTFIDWWQTRATSTPIGRPPVCTYEPQKCAISANGRLVARFAWEIVSARTGPMRRLLAGEDRPASNARALRLCSGIAWKNRSEVVGAVASGQLTAGAGTGSCLRQTELSRIP